MAGSVRLGVDTGGTFTDLCLLDEASGRLAVAKVPSTPANPAEAVLAGLRQLLEAQGFHPRDLRFLIHGTTVATNALLERKGAPTALVTTEGFEDVLHIGRQNRPALYDFRARRPAPIVPRHNRFGARERVLHTGEIFRALDTAGIREIARALRERGIASVAVSLLHAYANPVHERQIRSILADRAPEICVTLSSDVLPEFREYERTSTVCVNAYVMPKVERYVADLEKRLRELESASDLYIMQSSGGVITARTARAVSARTVLSGPAGGALTGARLSRDLETPDVITLDMGGTSTDICLIEAGTPKVSTECEIGGHPIKLPMIDINTIGAGGGSIARIDAGGALRVGPESAGADPGPACYGRGGREPTVTDANAVLGRLSPSSLLAGVLPIDLDAARAAVREGVARPMGLSVEKAAEGIIEVVNAGMLRGIRRVSVERGHDPRAFSLVAFGGAGPLHAVALARALDIREVIVPLHPGIASAFGMLFADVRHDYVQTLIAPVEEADPDAVRSVFERMETRARRQLSREGFSPGAMVLVRAADMRYPRQAHELTVSLEALRPGPDALPGAASRFHDLHEKSYGYARRDDPVEMVNLRLTALGKLPAPAPVPRATGDRRLPDPAARRPVIFDGIRRDTPVFRRDRLAPGVEIPGPAVLEQLDATVLLPPGCRAAADPRGNLRIRWGGKP